jgi:hypothetical protein
VSISLQNYFLLFRGCRGTWMDRGSYPGYGEKEENEKFLVLRKLKRYCTWGGGDIAPNACA